MKNHSFGDIRDYGKLSLLRFLSQQGISVAINWYMTDSNKKSNTKDTVYLDSSEFWKYDPELYRHLKEFVIVQNKRDVSLFDLSSLISDIKTYSGVIEDPGAFVKEERQELRSSWHKKALAECAGADLVFLDPDNGFRESLPKVVKDHVKYCYADELRDYFDSGADVVINNNKGTRTGVQWTNTMSSIKKTVPSARLMTMDFRKEHQCIYVFVIHPEREKRYEKLKHFFDYDDC